MIYPLELNFCIENRSNKRQICKVINLVEQNQHCYMWVLQSMLHVFTEHNSKTIIVNGAVKLQNVQCSRFVMEYQPIWINR